jgi:hypothetical protein
MSFLSAAALAKAIPLLAWDNFSLPICWFSNWTKCTAHSSLQTLYITAGALMSGLLK